MNADYDELARAARAAVDSLTERAKKLRRAGHDGLALEIELEATRLNVPLRALDDAARQRTEDAQLRRLMIGGRP